MTQPVVVCPIQDMALPDDIAAAVRDGEPIHLPSRSRQRHADDAVRDFLADHLISCGMSPAVAEAAVEQTHLFRYEAQLSSRAWTAYPPNNAAEPDEPRARAGTLLLIPPGSAVVRAHPEAGGAGGGSRTITAEPMRAVLAIVPLGMTFEVQPPLAGILTSPLCIPSGLAAMIPSRTAPIQEPRDLNARTVRELQELTDTLTEALEEITLLREEAAAALEQAQRQPRLTATLARVRKAAPRPPFVVILRDSYHPQTDPERLRGDDALTFNGLLKDYPTCPLRLVNVAVHDDAVGWREAEQGVFTKTRAWEHLLADAPGWVDSCDDPQATEAAQALSGFTAFYGGYDMPGAIEGSCFDDHPDGPTHNLRWSVLLVSDPS